MEISELEGQEKPQFFAEFFCIKGQDLFCFFTLKGPFVCKKIVHNDVSFSFPPAEPPKAKAFERCEAERWNDRAFAKQSGGVC